MLSIGGSGEVLGATDRLAVRLRPTDESVVSGFVDCDGRVVTHGTPFAGQSAVFIWQSACDAVIVSPMFPSSIDM
jgi:hypothetical protein